MSEAAAVATTTEAAPVTSLLDSPATPDLKADSNAGTGNVPAQAGSLLDPPEPEKTEPSSTAPNGADTKATSDQTKTGTEDPNKKTEAVQGAPEKYEEFKLAEGIKLEEATANELKATAKELNLTQHQAQKLVDLHSKTVLDAGKQAQDWYKSQVAGWQKETIETLGSNYKDELAVARKTMGKYGTPELSKLLNNYGLSEHKEVVNLLIKVGKSFSEDNFAAGNNEVQREKKSPALVLYGNTK